MNEQSGQQSSLAESTDREEGTRRQSLIEKIFGRHLMHMAILLLLPMILSGLRNPSIVLHDPDIWWHLADARILCETHHFIHAEPYSFTVRQQPWVDPEWLSEIPFWLGYKGLGLTGIYLVTWLAVSANIQFVYWRSYWKARNASVALWISAIGFVLMWTNANSRTILFGYLALSAELAILEAVDRGRTGYLWCLPFIFCVWINLHGSWLIGVGLFALYILCAPFRLHKGMFEQDPIASKLRNTLLIAFLISVAALLLNPYGWHLVWNPFDMALNQKLNIANVNEWQPLNLEWFVGKVAAAVIAATILLNALWGRKWKIYEFVFVLFAWYAAFDHARFTFLAAVLTIPLFAADVTRGLFPAPPSKKTIPIMNALIAAAVIWVATMYFPSEASLKEALAAEWPLKTIAEIEPSWRTFHQEHLGGIMDFRGKPTFIDTRWDTFEHHGVMKDFIDIVHLQNSLALLDKYGIDHVLLKRSEPLCYLLEHVNGWKGIGTEGTGDKQYELFERAQANAR